MATQYHAMPWKIILVGLLMPLLYHLWLVLSTPLWCLFSNGYKPLSMLHLGSSAPGPHEIVRAVLMQHTLRGRVLRMET